jgi:hypothetical protein
MNTENSSSGSVVEEIKMREEIEKVCSLKGAIDKNHTTAPTAQPNRPKLQTPQNHARASFLSLFFAYTVR